MGHYTAEMRSSTSDTEALRSKYWATREKLEKLESSQLTVGQLGKIQIIFLETQSLGSPFCRDDKGWMKQMVRKMEALIPKDRLKKPSKKK